MPTIAEVRQKYPQYSDMSDDALASALHSKYYSDMPADQFRQKIGLSAPKTEKPEEGLLDKAKGAGETALHMASGGVASLAGGLASAGANVENAGRFALNKMGASLPAVDPKAAMEQVQGDLTYQPKTEAGKRYTQAVETPGRIYQEKTDRLADQASRVPVVGPALGAGVKVGAAALPLAVAPEAGRMLGRNVARAGESVKAGAERVATAGEAKAAVRAAEEAPKQAKIEAAKSIGLKIPPSEAGGPVGKVLEGVSGKVQTEMAFSRDNAKAINRTAGKEIGLSDRQPMTEANIDRLKKKAFAVYDRVKKAGRITADPDFKGALAKVRERTAQAEEDYPEDTNELIDKEIQKFDRPSADASSMLEKIKSLRSRASRNMQAPDAEKFELGIAQKKIATAMEDLIDRQVGGKDPGAIGGGVSAADPMLITDFRAARQQLAKIYNVEDALGPNGNLSAAVLARQLKRGVPLSGGLKTIAETYQEFPKVMRYVDNLGGHAPFSALDYLVGGVEAMAHPAGAARVVGALAGRPIARALIKSKTYQRAAIKPREIKPSLAARTARKIAGPNTLQSVPPESGALTLSDQ